MSDRASHDSLDGLLERLCIEGLAESEWRELAASIADDENALRSFIEAVQWQQSLGYLVGGESPADGSSFHFVDEAVASDAAMDRSELELAGDQTTALNEPILPVARTSRDFLRSWVIGASVAFLAGAGITAVALHLTANESESKVADAPREPAPVVAPAPFIQENQLGKVSGLSLEASADGLLRSLQVGQELRCGEVVQLTSGFMRVALHSGPELIIEGPAEFSIIGKESVFLRIGRVAATSGAEKLLLQSPRLTAECNDANVYFIVDEDTSTNVYAYKGVVTMRNIAHRDSSNGKLAVLHEGHGLRVQLGLAAEELLSNISTIPPEGAVRDWTEVESRLSDTQRLVLSDRPVAYWPLHRVRRNRRVLDLTQNGFDGQAIGNWPTELDANAPSEPGALFNGESYIEPDRKPSLDFRTGFTIESWAKVSGGPEFQSIFTSRWVLDAHTQHLQCLGFTLYAGKNDRWQLWTGSGRYGELSRELHSDVELARRRWTHVVASFEPEESTDVMPAEFVNGTARIFVDGKLVAEEVREMSLMSFEWPARIGAAEFVPNSLTAWLFRGSLRDIAVYDYPLEQPRIQAHYEAGKAEPGKKAG